MVATRPAYEQVTRYLRWIESITTSEEFDDVQVFIIALQIGKIRKAQVNLNYESRIRMYSIEKSQFVELQQ